ncbi:MAG: hypothetical protein A2X25_10240 [Chloroflexi bacterium GWB2_49_20]|nr:MAG: hypothetical protein A2X25_10240 [Chloroflexi bacterium GWB2_49_20]OGN79204.1 MAG: hypothetical protein A2X26_03780 [Chloroflexi bacterium GWC2_49_37]OGN83026.1 MAG: hypothetical protein A2X27_08915 [Chloroflexi bacterium GWD2_49_16]
MKKNLLVIVFLLVLAALLVACGGQTTQAPTDAPTSASIVTEAPTEAPVALSGDPIQGGLLYDDWVKVLGVDAPTDNQPLWGTQTTNTRSGKDTWRCKECHGWDYNGVNGAYGKGSHMTGFVGVSQVAGTDASAILAALKGATNPDHDFSSVMDDQALTNLALFLNDYQFDTSFFIGADKLATSGDAVNGKNLFYQNCSYCHGPQGLSMNFADDSDPEYYGTIASDNPWEFIHKARFGQPNAENMPSMVDLGLSDAEYADLLAYAQTLPTSSPVTEGGRLYDKWFAALGVDAPAGDQPLWATQTTNTRTGADTWRCKECHGWDYKGVDGRYGSGSHQTGFPGILDAAAMSPEELTAWLDGSKNADHNFSTYMTADDFARLVAFIQKDVFDKSTIINDDKTVVGGDATHGKLLFDSVCKVCHGTDGKTFNFGSDSEPEYFGTIAADNPWEFFNKATVGVPGEAMPAGWNLGWNLQDIIDLLTYAQTLPTK